jgi:hypothetical protein
MILPPPNQVDRNLTAKVSSIQSAQKYILTSSTLKKNDQANQTLESQINQRLKELSSVLSFLKLSDTANNLTQSITLIRENLTHTKIETSNQANPNPSNNTTQINKNTQGVSPASPNSKNQIEQVLGANEKKLSKKEIEEYRKLFYRKIDYLEIISGKYEGAYLSAPDGYISWYFANLALVHNIDNQPRKVKKYLNLYLANIEPNFSILDVESDQKTKISPDSNDSYAATYLQLASRYTQKTGDYTWFKTNLKSLKQIADKNLIDQQKSSGLISTFQNGKPHNISYLMDNAEVYAGLIKFANTLRAIDDKDADKYQNSANKITLGIDTLWDEKNHNWLVSDSSKATGKVFYPDLTAQIFPEMYGLKIRNETLKFNQAYNYFSSNDQTWFKLQSDPYPWMILSYYNIQSNRNTGKATEMLQNFVLNLNNINSKYTINELGWAIGALNML